MYPISFIYVLQSLHVHPSGFHFDTLALNDSKFLADLISSGIEFHIVGPLYLNVSFPLVSVLTFGIIQLSLIFCLNIFHFKHKYSQFLKISIMNIK